MNIRSHKNHGTPPKNDIPPCDFPFAREPPRYEDVRTRSTCEFRMSEKERQPFLLSDKSSRTWRLLAGALPMSDGFGVWVYAVLNV